MNGISFVNRLNEEESDYVEDDLAALERKYTDAKMDEAAIQKEIDELLALRT